MKLIKKLLFFIIFVLVVVILARNYLVKLGAEQFVKKQTGLALKMEGLNIGLVDTKIDIDDLRLYNPSNYEEKLMVNIPDIYVDYNLPEIIKGNIHLNEIRFHLNEVIIVTNKAGQTNIEALKALQPPAKEGEQPKKEAPAPKKKGKERIDKMALRIDRIVYKDYSGGGEPKIVSKDINVNKTYENIDGFNKVTLLITRDVLLGASLGNLNLSGVNLDSISESLGGTLKGATDVLGGSADNLLKGADSLKD
ncbi:MAG: hypothetical protein K8I00_03455, partial [Candidatus Omnitrophica bacterium]|nr:hypothetical protein [Candidatus Omnitrophota bacterium]